MSEWKEKPIKIRIHYGWLKLAHAWVKDGLAIHGSVEDKEKGELTITKTSSGQRISGKFTFKSLSTAKACAYKLLKLCDWKKPGYELRKDKDLDKKIRNLLIEHSSDDK